MRLERLLSIVILLINRKQITARELSTRFEVSIRTILRDLEAINAAGIPLVSRQGKQGGFSILESFKLDKMLLTIDEISSIMSLLKGLAGAVPNIDINHTITKISTLVPHSLLPAFESKNNQLILDMRPWNDSPAYQNKISQIREAMEQNRIISFCYTNSDGIFSKRNIEPMSIILKGNHWYVHGYCLLREDFRFFKVTRIMELCIDETTFIKRKFDFADETKENEGWTSTTVNLLLRFHPFIRQRVTDIFRSEEITLDANDFLIVTVAYPESLWLYSFILSFGNMVEVLEPSHIRERIISTAQAMFSLYHADIQSSPLN